MRAAQNRIALVMALLLISATASAQSPPQTDANVDIPSQSLAGALRQFAQQTGLEIAYTPALTDGLHSGAVKGRLTPSKVLEGLLAGTGLKFKFLSSREVAIVRVGPKPQKPAPRTSLMAPSPRVEDGPTRTVSDAGASTGRSMLQEVIVTAQMRAENVQRVPMSITTLSAGTLEESGVHSIEGLAQVVPGLSFDNAVPGQEHVTLRGIAASGETTPTVAIYLDDVPLPTGPAPGSTGASDVTGGAAPAILDLDRVEVLRGPQGTLYGASSMGGTIRYITKSPDPDHTAGDFGAEAGWTDFAGGPNYRGTAVLNVPLVTGVAALRGGIQYRHDAGYANRKSVDNVLSPDTNRADLLNARLEGLVRLGGSVELKPMLYIQNSRLNDVPVFASSLPPFAKYANFPETQRDTMRLAALTATAGIGEMELTSVTAYADRDLSYLSDYTNYIYGLLEGVLSGVSPAYGPLALPFRTELTVPNEDHTLRRDVSQELRLASADPTARLQWIAGAYFSRDRSSFVQDITVPGWDTVGNATLTPVLGANPLASFNDQPFFVNLRIDTNQYALFGDVTYHLTNRWVVQAGARWFDDSRERTRVSGGLFAAGAGKFVAEPPLPSSDHGFTPRFSLQYKVSSSSMLYATAAKGFRQGGANATIPNTPQCSADIAGYKQQTGRVAPDEYQPDTVWSYEVGSKNTLFNGRVRANADLYYLKWSNIQQTFSLDNYGPGGCGFNIGDNAGSATSKGAELELAARVTTALTLRGALSYDRANLDAATAGLSTRLPFAPETAFSLGADYSARLWRRFSGLVHIDESFAGAEVRGFVPSSPTYYEDHRSVTNVRLSLISAGGIETSLFAENLFNAAPIIDIYHPVTSAAAAAVAGLPVYTRYTTLMPRTIGLSVALSF